MNGTHATVHWPPVVLAVALHLVIGAIGAWDIWAIARGNYRDTVSNLIGEWGATFPIMPLIVGIVIGHLFWPRHQ